MNDIVAQLQALKEDVPSPLSLPDEDDIIDIEAELLVPLADDFKEYLLTASDVVYGRLEPVTIVDPGTHTYLPDVAALAWDRGMPRQLLPLCECAEGYYAISEDGAVFLWQPGQGMELFDSEPLGSIWDWVESVWLPSAAPSES